LVSNTSRTLATGVASMAPKSPIPALLTSTSMDPLASSAAAMLAAHGGSDGRFVVATLAATRRTL